MIFLKKVIKSQELQWFNDLFYVIIINTFMRQKLNIV